jgi:predicted RNase H-like HicB family nuclease
MAEYTIIIERAEGNYSAYCPDLPGCIATGSTIEETIQRMKEAIKFHLEGLKEGEIAIPEPPTKAVSIEVTA